MFSNFRNITHHFVFSNNFWKYINLCIHSFQKKKVDNNKFFTHSQAKENICVSKFYLYQMTLNIVIASIAITIIKKIKLLPRIDLVITSMIGFFSSSFLIHFLTGWNVYPPKYLK